MSLNGAIARGVGSTYVPCSLSAASSSKGSRNRLYVNAPNTMTMNARLARTVLRMLRLTPPGR